MGKRTKKDKHAEDAHAHHDTKPLPHGHHDTSNKKKAKDPKPKKKTNKSKK
ncbi:hypothetical protein IT570_03485 [Candidatus Sumerlaeota bacterium]|nr:hypothetical protein [Candidatus Sumerlaeota bacterium]